MEVIENGMVIEIVINSDDFLLHMARMIVGALLEVGKGKLKAEDIQKILVDKKRSDAFPIAQPKGLCLRDVQYELLPKG